MAEDMVAPIASDPVTMSVALTDYRSQRDSAQSRSSAPTTETLLPPVPAPVPTPVPTPAIVPPIEAFAAALAAADQPTPATDALTALRLTAQWSPPPSDLTLTDRLV
jgi:hypothetical protein